MSTNAWVAGEDKMWCSLTPKEACKGLQCFNNEKRKNTKIYLSHQLDWYDVYIWEMWPCMIPSHDLQPGEAICDHTTCAYCNMWPYYIGFQWPLDKEVREWVPVSSPCKSNLDQIAPYVTFDYDIGRGSTIISWHVSYCNGLFGLRGMVGSSAKSKFSSTRVKWRRSYNTS